MEEMEEKEVSIFKGALKVGGIIGAINVVFTLLLYIVNAELLGLWWLGFFLGIAGFIIMVIVGIKFRNEGTGYLTFGKAFLYSLVGFSIAGLIGTLFNIVLYSAIDPDLAQVVGDAQIESIVGFSESFGAPEAALEAQREQLEADTPANFTPVGFLKGLGFWVLLSAFFGIFTALIIKKREPIVDDF